MPQPTLGQVHVNRPLTNMSVQYRQDAANFVASRVFPTIPVDKKTDSYYIFTKNDFQRDQMQPRPPGTESAGSGWNLSTTTYNCSVWALHKDTDNQTQANYDQPLDWRRNSVQYLTQNALIRLENQWVTDYFATSVWATDSTPANLWSNYSTSDPMSDIETAKRTVLLSTGQMPNTLVLGYDVYIQLKNHPDLVERIKYTSSQILTAQLMASLFDIPRVFVAQGVYATNVEGETAATAFTHGKHALVCYSNPAPAIEMPSAGYTFEWRGVSDGLGETVGITEFYEQRLKSTRIEIESAWDNKVVGTDLGYFFASVVA